MSKAKKIWIAEHPDEPGNQEVSFTEPHESGTYLHTDFHSGEGTHVEWKEFIMIEVES